MINKGKSRANGKQLGEYLGRYENKKLSDYLVSDKNERVEVLELRGSAFPDLDRSLASWETEAQGTRCKKPLWHAQMSPKHGERLTRDQQLEAVAILEKHLGFDGQPRAIVVHEKDGHEHIHVTWSRMDRATGKARRDGFTHRKNSAAAREIEQRFGLEVVASPEFKNDDKTKTREQRREESRKAPDYREFQKAKRTGLDPRERKDTITRLWHECDSGKALRAALQDAGYILARGSSRAYVIVDEAGDTHSLARQINGALAADVKERLASLDPASIPKATDIERERRRAWQEREGTESEPPPNPSQPKQRPKLHARMRDAPLPIPGPFDKPPEKNPLDPTTILAAMTERTSTFTKDDLDRAIKRRLKKEDADDSKEAISALARQVRATADFVVLGKDRVGRPRFTSRDILEAELAMRNASDDMVAAKRHPVKPSIKENAPTVPTLRPEQRAAFDHITEPSALSIVRGLPGTGKSYMLGAAREAWEGQGYRVRGAALASMAAKALQEGSKIKSRTLHSLLYALDNVEQQNVKIRELEARRDQVSGTGGMSRQVRFDLQTQIDKRKARLDADRLSNRDVIVLDEAGMIGSKQLNRLLQLAHKAGAKVVLVGDAEQLQAIDAGAAFRALCDRHGAVELTDIRRQKEEWQKKATKDFAQSFTAEGLSKYLERDRIHHSATQNEARTRMVAAWTKARIEEPEQAQLMMAYTKVDVAFLNNAAREVYKAEGAIKGQDAEVATATGKRDFAVGDRLYFLANNLSLGVMNGSLGTVRELSQILTGDKGHRFMVELDDGKKISFDTADYDHISHGYASTIHKAQGATVYRSHLLASQYMDRHATCVGMSRQTDHADLYYSTEEFESYDQLRFRLSREGRKDTTLDYLDRAEKAGQRDKFIDKVMKVVRPPAPEPGDTQKPISERFMAMLEIDRSKTKDQRKAERLAKDGAQRLRDILDRADRDRGREYSR